MRRIFTFCVALFAAGLLFPQGASHPQITGIDFEEIPFLEKDVRAPIKVTGNALLDAVEPGGSGSEANPYLIASLANLLWVAENTQHWDKHYLQTEDIDAAETSEWFDGTGWLPIGTSETYFSGLYNGNNKTINNLLINRTTNQYQGLFGYNYGIIENLAIENAQITDNGSRAGILVGLNYGSIDNCHTSGEIIVDHADGRVGGLVGWNNSTISNSSSAANVYSIGINVGGLVGVSHESIITNCAASGNVEGYDRVGGLVGNIQSNTVVSNCQASGNVTGSRFGTGGLVGYSLSGSIINNCSAAGNVIGQDFNTGGLVGYNISANIFGSHSTGQVTGVSYSGGLIGYCSGPSEIENCYSTSDVFGNDQVGGLIGRADNSSISNSYSQGHVSASGNWVGGLVGANSNNLISASFSISTVIVQGVSAGGLCGTCENNSTVFDSYATGNVSGSQYIGGLIGYGVNCNIVNVYSIGRVNAVNQNLGGLIGSIGENVEVSNSYWDIEMSGLLQSFGGEGKTTAEMISQTTFSSIWNFEEIWAIVNNQTYPYLQWQQEPGDFNYAPDFFNLTLIADPANGGSFIGGGSYPAGGIIHLVTLPAQGYGLINWADEANNDLGKETSIFYSMPAENMTITAHFAEIAFAGGTGTAADPWLIETAYHLNNIRYFLGETHQEKHFKLISSINLGVAPWNQGLGWLPIGIFNFPDPNSENLAFFGTLDGNGHIIDGLTINRTDQRRGIALFAFTNGASISDLGLTNVDVTGFDYVASLIGQASNTMIENCFSTGIIRGNFQMTGGLFGLLIENSSVLKCNSACEVINQFSSAYAGGLAGGIWDGLIEKSYATGNVLGSGGLIGISRASTIKESFSTGNISGNNYVGGLVGYLQNSGEIENCFSTSNVSGNLAIGGLVGLVSETNVVLNSFSVGSITGNFDVGGLVGKNIGTVTSSYWDTEVSGLEISDGGEGRTTQEMTHPYAANTYVDWDFETIWAGDADATVNDGYPYLQFQIVKYELSVDVSPGEGGTVTGSGHYGFGETVTITATATTNFAFTHWSGDTGYLDHADTETATLTMPSKTISLTANFQNLTTINEMYLADLKVFPNPAQTELWVEFSNPESKNINIQLANLQGQIVDQKSIDEQGKVQASFNVSGLHPGVYLLLIKGDKWNVARKVVVKP
jgi:hypothetical protein